MEYRTLGNSGLKVTPIGLGTWAVGGGPWWGDSDEKQSIAAIHAAIDSGVNLVDTAPCYGFGYSEEVVGKALKGRRDKVVLSTKCGLWWHDERKNFAFELGGTKVYKCLQAETIRREVEISLKRLQTDHIDIYHTHWPDVTTAIEETARCLEDLRKSGKIGAIAVSNADEAECAQYIGNCKLSANQLKYSMLDRDIENTMVDFCIKNDMGILAYSPLEQGLLTGKIGMDKTFTDTEYRNFIPWYKLSNRKKVLGMLDKWKVYTEKYDCSLAQLVIAWTYSQKGITVVLCGARKPQNAIENAKALELKLEPADIAAIRADVTALGNPE